MIQFSVFRFKFFLNIHKIILLMLTHPFKLKFETIVSSQTVLVCIFL